MRRTHQTLALLLALVLGAVGSLLDSRPALAARGAPGSTEFGYGARLYLDGPYFQDALAAAIDLPLDWVSIPLSWRDFPVAEAGTSARWQKLDRAMQSLAGQSVAVMLSLSQPPAAALTPTGPDAAKTAEYARFLAGRYAGVLQAVELLPNPNIQAGWGAPANPSAYWDVYQAVSAALANPSPAVLVVTGGLRPVAEPGQGDMNETRFLAALYTAAGENAIPVVGLDLSRLESAESLRRYDGVRQVMTAASRRNELLWITAFAAPSGTIGATAPAITELEQSNWLYESTMQMRSQLYIGVTFYESLNPAIPDQPALALVADTTNYHPFYPILRKMIAQNAPEATARSRGRAKDEALDKIPP